MYIIKNGVLYAACIISMVATTTPSSLVSFSLWIFYRGGNLLRVLKISQHYHVYAASGKNLRGSPPPPESKKQNIAWPFFRRAFLIKTFFLSFAANGARAAQCFILCSHRVWLIASNAFHACLDPVPIAYSSPLSRLREEEVRRETRLRKVSSHGSGKTSKSGPHLNYFHEKVYRF